MRVLALADKRPPMDPALMAEQMGVQAVVCLGDLDLAWIESLRGLTLPKVGVHGNHDPPDLLREVEVEDLHGRRTSLCGRTVAGFEGCVRYGKGGPHHYTQKQASKLARRLPAADILICHCPPSASTTTPTTRPTSASRGCGSGWTAITRATSCTATRTRSPGSPRRATATRACTGSRARACFSSTERPPRRRRGGRR